jgi:SAM-dependent methyltransferase
MTELPVPSVDLANRSGQIVEGDGSFAAYETAGAELRHVVLGALPKDWVWTGKRVLDFGCGAGRVLRHFAGEARDAEFWGCDIHADSVDWINTNLRSMQAFVNSEDPPLASPDGSFDLVYAFSVFTHLTENWSSWLLELHRLLSPDGILIASFLGAGMSEAMTGEPWSEEDVGMNVLADRGWDNGGPNVLLSSWWITEHWGRVFDIERIDDAPGWGTQGCVVARPKPSRPSRGELERIDPQNAREITALAHNIKQLRREAVAAEERADLALQHAHYKDLLAELRRRLRAKCARGYRRAARSS